MGNRVDSCKFGSKSVIVDALDGFMYHFSVVLDDEGKAASITLTEKEIIELFGREAADKLSVRAGWGLSTRPVNYQLIDREFTEAEKKRWDLPHRIKLMRIVNDIMYESYELHLYSCRGERYFKYRKCT